MMNFKNRDAFTLLEAIVALATIGSVVTMLLLMQGQVMQKVKRVSSYEDRMLLMRAFLSQARREAQEGTTTFSFSKQVKQPSTLLQYKRTAPHKKSVLAKRKGLYIERVTASWQEMSERVEEVLVAVSYIPTQSKEQL